MRKRRYTREWYVSRPDELDIQLDEDSIDIAIEYNEQLQKHSSEWFELYYRGRNLANRPPYDEEKCTLKGIQLYPYSTVGDKYPAVALIGIYDVELDPRFINGTVHHPIETRYDHDPVFLEIDTHGGNMDYLSCVVADLSQERKPYTFDLSEHFSIHMAEIMAEYYNRFTTVGSPF